MSKASEWAATRSRRPEFKVGTTLIAYARDDGALYVEMVIDLVHMPEFLAWMLATFAERETLTRLGLAP